ncbi:MAG TPA: DinB family protein [Candidatus Acidoferrales bacterium]
MPPTHLDLVKAREKKLGRLAAVRAELFATVQPLEDSSYRFRPGEPQWNRGWCVAEILLHLEKVESAIARGLEAAARGDPPPPSSWFSRLLRLPPRWVEYRILKASAPRGVRPDQIVPKEAMLSHLSELRQRLLETFARVPEGSLTCYRFPHPFLGTYNVLEWIELLGAHECRHLKQIREVLARQAHLSDYR